MTERRDERRPRPCFSTETAARRAKEVRRAPNDDPGPDELHDELAEREQAERVRGERATTEAEERAARRRADKAEYLKEKLAEQVDADARP